jgi:IS30 family transposase
MTVCFSGIYQKLFHVKKRTKERWRTMTLGRGRERNMRERREGGTDKKVYENLPVEF